MVKKYLEGDLSITKSLQEALMSCILCEACAKACPSGVRLDRVFENMRTELHRTLGPNFAKRALFAALRNPMLMRLGARIGHVGRRTVIAPLNVAWKMGNIPLNRFPAFNAIPFRRQQPEILPPRAARNGRVLYFIGCSTDLINEHVGRAVVEVLTRLGMEVIIPPGQVCCSVPMFLSGAREESLPNIEKNLRIFDRDDVDAIVVDCATCGGGLKKAIPHLMEDLGRDPERARRVAAKVRDVSEIVADRLDRLELDDGARKGVLTVTYHDPCHMTRSMGVSGQPRQVLAALSDVRIKEMAGADQCCGGAGAFQFEHVEMSAGVTNRKKESILATAADVLATGCPGCNLTLAGNLYEDGAPTVKHTIELVAERLAR
jgi:glycolate oxidase iron-sulfur subunit